MLRSMFSAISGLRAHQTKMDTVANNIANVNTVGYKTSNTVFETTLTQVLRNGKSPDATQGGANPAQIGLGVKLAAITTDFSQGKTQNTGRALDFMIQGDGFFVTKDGNQDLYTRAGSFSFDGSGKLITADGAILQGWMANDDGTVSTAGPTEDIEVSYGAVKAPKGTDAATLAGNLASGTASTDAPIQMPMTAFDDQGAEHTVSYSFQKGTGANTWKVTTSVDGATLMDTASPPAAITKTVVFGTDGKVASVDGTAGATSFSNALSWGSVTADMSSLTQFATGTKPGITTQTGYAAGTLESFSLLEDGTLMGSYSNGERQAIGKLALATFNNPAGLVNMGNTSYSAGDNSGNAIIGTAGNGAFGSLASGALEMSNVDLSEEFTGLIIAQRGFQANSRVISAADEILQDLVNLKR